MYNMGQVKTSKLSNKQEDVLNVDASLRLQLTDRLTESLFQRECNRATSTAKKIDRVVKAKAVGHRCRRGKIICLFGEGGQAG